MVMSPTTHHYTNARASTPSSVTKHQTLEKTPGSQATSSTAPSTTRMIRAMTVEKASKLAKLRRASTESSTSKSGGGQNQVENTDKNKTTATASTTKETFDQLRRLILGRSPNVDQIRELVEQDARVLERQDPNHGLLLLHWAVVFQNSLGVMQYLVEQSASTALLHADKEGRTPLHHACRADGRVELVEYLVQQCKKACLHKDNRGRTPLHCACVAYVPSDIVRILLQECPMAAKIRSKEGHIPLYTACDCKAPTETIHMLVDAYPEGVKLLSKSDDSPLMFLKATEYLEQKVQAKEKEVATKVGHRQPQPSNENNAPSDKVANQTRQGQQTASQRRQSPIPSHSIAPSDEATNPALQQKQRANSPIRNYDACVPAKTGTPQRVQVPTNTAPHGEQGWREDELEELLRLRAQLEHQRETQQSRPMAVEAEAKKLAKRTQPRQKRTFQPETYVLLQDAERRRLETQMLIQQQQRDSAQRELLKRQKEDKAKTALHKSDEDERRHQQQLARPRQGRPDEELKEDARLVALRAKQDAEREQLEQDRVRRLQELQQAVHRRHGRVISEMNRIHSTRRTKSPSPSLPKEQQNPTKVADEEQGGQSLLEAAAAKGVVHAARESEFEVDENMPPRSEEHCPGQDVNDSYVSSDEEEVVNQSRGRDPVGELREQVDYQTSGEGGNEACDDAWLSSEDGVDDPEEDEGACELFETLRHSAYDEVPVSQPSPLPERRRSDIFIERSRSMTGSPRKRGQQHPEIRQSASLPLRASKVAEKDPSESLLLELMQTKKLLEASEHKRHESEQRVGSEKMEWTKSLEQAEQRRLSAERERDTQQAEWRKREAEFATKMKLLEQEQAVLKQRRASPIAPEEPLPTKTPLQHSSPKVQQPAIAPDVPSPRNTPVLVQHSSPVATPKGSMSNDWTDTDGKSPLHLACEHNASFAIIQMMVNAFPTALATADKEGNLPLHHSCQCNSALEVLQLLIQAYPAAVRTPNERGLKPLHLACINPHHNGRVEVVQLLLRFSSLGNRPSNAPTHISSSRDENEVPLYHI